MSELRDVAEHIREVLDRETAEALYGRSPAASASLNMEKMREAAAMLARDRSPAAFVDLWPPRPLLP